MSINWSTFLLEVVNFLVLVWILKRFLYQPVLNVIAARKRSIQEEKERVDADRRDAEALRAEALGQLERWEAEREAKRDALERELEERRAQALAELETVLADERRKAEAVREEREREDMHELERRALGLGAAFVSRFVERLSGPELEARLAALLIEELDHLPPTRQEELRATFGAEDTSEFRVSSTFPVEDDLARRLTHSLRRALGSGLPVRFVTDPQLILGLRVHAGHWVLAANLRDELRFFSENGLGTG